MIRRSLRILAGPWSRRILAAGLLLAVAAPFGVARAASDDPPAFIGLMGQFTLIEPLRPAPDTRFRDASGAELSFASFRGKVLLVNFWATWCAPCIREMPTIDRLQAELGGESFAVLAISTDRKGGAVVKAFLERLGLRNLDTYLDPKRKTFTALGARGLPTTFLIDHQGRVAGYLEGPAEWDSKESKALIRYYVRRAEQAAARARDTAAPKG